MVVSLDFELMWGMFDKVTKESYGENLEGVHEVIPKILEVLKNNDIHATWATVGMLMSANKSELMSLTKDLTKPRYNNQELSAFEHLSKADIEETDSCYFARGLVKQIAETPNQEIASHTFSHFYCLEDQTDQATKTASLNADAEKMEAVSNELGIHLSSIVFPRNQWSKDVLRALGKTNIRTYRGTEDHFLYRARKEKEQTNLFIRGLRLLDHYLNLSGHHTYQVTTVNRNTPTGFLNIPASRFLRPYSMKLRLLEPLRLRRIKRAMERAAQNCEVFHLWWHPHNFGINQEENLRNLEELIRHFKDLKETYGMESCTMAEVSAKFSSVPTPSTTSVD